VKRINVNLFPKGGFIFKESDGTTISGNTWEGVKARVRSYRKRNNLPPGDPDNEVRAQACQRDPVICHEDDGQHRAAIKIANLKSRVLQWFSSLKSRNSHEPLRIGDSENAKRRGDICAVCPHNKELPDGCSSCRAAISELRINLVGGQKFDSRLIQHGCNILGADLAAQVYIDDETVDNPELPDNCWRKRTL
jgi:hypothetical protein